jgi:hypothetical protein
VNRTPSAISQRYAAGRRRDRPGTVLTILLVLFFRFVQQISIDAPLLDHMFAPGSTVDRVAPFRPGLIAPGRPAAVIRAAVIGLS